jgi:hypothetical protein
MNQQDKGGLNQLIEGYMALWNEPNAERRRALITELWAEDGVQFTNSREHRGYQALVERVSSAYEQFVQAGGFIFRLSSDVNAHHNGVKFSWEMVPAAGGDVAAVGFVFLLLNDEGRIGLDYQF